MNEFSRKSSVEKIAGRFDHDVERFSNLESGQQTTIDATVHMDLITDSIVALHPELQTVLDVGCGAGNSTLKLISNREQLDRTLVDLRLTMIQREKVRIDKVNSGSVNTVNVDIRRRELNLNHSDAIMVAAVVHHLK